MRGKREVPRWGNGKLKMGNEEGRQAGGWEWERKKESEREQDKNGS